MTESMPQMEPRRIDEVIALEAALLTSELSDKVDIVLRRSDHHRYRVSSARGWIEFERHQPIGDPAGLYEQATYVVTHRHGENPIASQALDVLSSIDEERLQRRAGGGSPSYPNAHESISQFFDSPDAPDLFICRQPGFDPEGNNGHHGSLSITQARSLLIVSGAGTRNGAPASGHERTVDIAPTIASLLALEPDECGRHLARQDGIALEHLLDGSRVGHVVVLLLDGCNTNLLTDVIASGEAPTLAGLVDTGSILRHGMIASLPTATLANHTAAVTGLHPGHSGVLNHTWLKRRTGQVPELLSFEEMFWSSSHLAPGAETIFEAISRQRSQAFSSATFEFCDRGATMSTFAMVREGENASLPELSVVRHAHTSACQKSESYGFATRVDHLSMLQTIGGWDRVQGNALPTLSWCSFSLTDEAGHKSGPHGELARQAIIDTDARVAEIVRSVERAGAIGETAFLVISDHGMEQTDPAITGDWHSQLESTGVKYRDIGDGLIYID